MRIEWVPKHAKNGVDLYKPLGYFTTMMSEIPEIKASSPIDSPKRVTEFLQDYKKNIRFTFLHENII